MPSSLRRHLFLPRRPRGERTGRLLLAALAADRPGGHPDNVAATARLVGTAERTVRRWRDELLEAGLLARAGGFLVLGPAWPAFLEAAAAEFAARGLRFGWDPLPRRLLGDHDPSVLWAAAVVHGDAVGPAAQNQGRWVRADAERAQLANVARSTVVAARRLLDREGLDAFEELRRGRATLRRARWRADSKASHGSPMGTVRAAAWAAAGERGRAAATRTSADSGTRTCTASHHESPTGTDSHRAAAAPPGTDGRARPAEPDGRQQAATERRAETRRFLDDRPALRRWLERGARDPERACRQLLELAGCFDTAPGTRAKWAGAIARRHDREAPVLLACLVADVADAGGRGRARSLGAVLARRLPRLLAGKGLDALSERHRGATPAAVLGLESVAPPSRRAAPPAPPALRTRDALPLAAAVPFDAFLRNLGLDRLAL